MTNLPSEIFEKSKCLDKELGIIREIEAILYGHGFTKYDMCQWRRGNKNVVVRLVDDFTVSCGNGWGTNFPYGLSRDTLVITDNLVNSVTQFEVMRLPNSFFGIYAYEPAPRLYEPDKRYSLLVNRIDSARFNVLLAWFADAVGCDIDVMDRDSYFTVNCVLANSVDRRVLTKEEAGYELVNYWQLVEQSAKNDYYHRTYSTLRELLPYRNFTVDFDSVASKSWVNLILETYTNDRVFSLSEKTFRALVTNAPAMIYGSSYLSAWLTQLGFDVCDDIINKQFEQNLSGSWGMMKAHDYVAGAINNSLCLMSMGVNQVSHRVVKASQHNIGLLQSFASKWPSDFALWKMQLEEKIKKW